MPLQQFLKTCSQDFVQQSPIQVVSEVSTNQYFYLDPTDLEPIWIDQEQMNQAPAPAHVQTKSLLPLSKTIWNGGSVVTLDYGFLSGKKAQILNGAANWVGASCFYLTHKNNIPFKKITSVTSIDSALQNLTHGYSNDVFLLANPGTLSTLKQGLMKQRIGRQPTGKLRVHDVIDYVNPIFSPTVRDSEIIVFNWNNSFVLASPTFLIQKNKLIFEFKVDIQSLSSIEAFKL